MLFLCFFCQANSIFRELANLVVSQDSSLQTLDSNMEKGLTHAG